MPYSRYSGYGTDPAEYAMGQQGRQDEQFRNLINMMIALSKWKTEQSQYSQEWQNKSAEQAAARSIEERRTKAYEESVKGREESIPEWRAKWNVALEHFGGDQQKAAEWILGIKQVETPGEKRKLDLEKFEKEEQIKAKYKEPREPKTIPQHELPQYRQGQFIDKAITDLEGERGKLISATEKAKGKGRKDLTWQIGNIDMGLNKLRFSRAKISGTNKPLDEREWAKIVAVGSDMNKVRQEREFWADRFPTISAKNVPEGTEYKLIGGRKTIKLGGVVYEVIE